MTILATDFEFIRGLLRREAGIALDDDKQYLVESRLCALMRLEGIPNLPDLVNRLRNGESAQLRHKVVEAMTTNETSFFRDVHPFEALGRVVIPELSSRRDGAHTFTIWSAASSSGQEAISLAITALETWPSGQVTVVGTDLNSAMVARARRGRYSQLEISRGLSEAAVARWFVREGSEWEVRPEVRRRLEFHEMNLAEPWRPLPSMDVVFLRNVLIYFALETRREIMRRLRAVLRPDGFLFLGGAESMLSVDEGFERLQTLGASYYRLRR